MELRKIRAADWDWIQQWFLDEDLNRELGPLDQEWLDYVLSAFDGIQLVAEQDKRPVGLIGCVWGDGGDLPHAISDIAIDPALRGKGQAKAIVQAVLAWPGHPSARRWVAFVFPENTRACHFFASLGWAHVGLVDQMNEYEFKVPASL